MTRLVVFAGILGSGFLLAQTETAGWLKVVETFGALGLLAATILYGLPRIIDRSSTTIEKVTAEFAVTVRHFNESNDRRDEKLNETLRALSTNCALAQREQK